MWVKGEDDDIDEGNPNRASHEGRGWYDKSG